MDKIFVKDMRMDEVDIEIRLGDHKPIPLASYDDEKWVQQYREQYKAVILLKIYLENNKNTGKREQTNRDQ